MRLFDTHAHINDNRFDNDRHEMLQQAFQSGVEYIICPGIDKETSVSALELAHTYKEVFAAVGVHPHESSKVTEEDYAWFKEVALQEEKVIAIGEIGLDFYYDFSDREAQYKAFIRQLEIAREVDLPIIIHDRDAHGAIRDVLLEHGKGNRGVFHCFSSSYEMAMEFSKMGYYISFAGPVVFPKSTNLKEAARKIPLDRILIETDSPYLTPPPFRGRRNDPSKVRYVAEEIALLKGLTPEEVALAALENSKRCFGIA